MAEARFGGATVLVLGDEAEVGAEAARRTVAALSTAVAERGVAHVALTGGSSAVSLYHALVGADLRGAVDWSRVHLWWGDERFVPIDHPESNAGLAYRLLLGMPAHAGQSGSGGEWIDIATGALPAVTVVPEHVHPVAVEETLSESEPVELAGELYSRELRRVVPLARGGVPRFDVIHTGVGPDGHIMSIFPDSPALQTDEPAIGVAAPDHVEPHLPRVTLGARVLPEAGLVLVMTSGESKRDIVAQILTAEREVSRLPAKAALLPNAVWLLDRAAAGDIATGVEPAAGAPRTD